MDGMETRRPLRSLVTFLSNNALLLSLALCKLFIHFMTNAFGGYGYIRDELYYLACSDHMAWGYVDHPPLSIAALRFSRLVFGDSLFAIRLLPAVSGAVVVALTCLITRELGGKRYAQILAALCVIAAPLGLGVDSVFSMNSFEVFFWTLAFYWIILVIKRDEQKYWFFLGITLGFGMLNKISVLWLGVGLMAGLLLTPGRALLLKRGVWLAGAIAFVIFLPHIVWQAASGFPTVEFIKNIATGKYAAVSPVEMFVQQALFMNPLTLPVWFAGLIYFLASKSMKKFRILPIIYLTVFLILVLNRNSKTAYLVPTFPMLFAIGAFTIDKFVTKFSWRFIKPIVLGLVAISGIALAPIVLAVLPVETFISYSQALGMAPSTSENNKLGRLPQYYADMFGWEEMVFVVANAYNTLAPEEKSRCAIFCNNYGEAGAIDFFGRKYNLPRAISKHNNYWLWGPGTFRGDIVIHLGGSEEALTASYDEVIQAGIVKNDYCMPYENNMQIWICKKRHTPLQDDWTRFKIFN